MSLDELVPNTIDNQTREVIVACLQKISGKISTFFEIISTLSIYPVYFIKEITYASFLFLKRQTHTCFYTDIITMVFIL